MTETLSEREVPPPSQVPPASQSSNDWTRDECLYIQLHFELIFAVASLPGAPIVIYKDASSHKRFGIYFAAQTSENDGQSNKIDYNAIKELEEFIRKREELVKGVWSAIQQLMKERVLESDPPIVYGVTITPPKLKAYKKIRETLGFDKNISNPQEYPELWSFLENAAREQFPELGFATFGADVPTEHITDATKTPGNNNDLTSAVASQQISTPAMTSKAKIATVDITRTQDADVDPKATTQSTTERTQVEPDKVSPTKTRAPKKRKARATTTHALELVHVQCPIETKDKKKCTRTNRVPVSERDTWRCHIHLGMKNPAAPWTKKRTNEDALATHSELEEPASKRLKQGEKDTARPAMTEPSLERAEEEIMAVADDTSMEGLEKNEAGEVETSSVG